MLFLFLLQLLETQTQFTNIEKSFIDGQSENQGWTMLTQDQNLVNDQLCDQLNHTNFFSPQAGIIKLLRLPPHNKIEISYQVIVVGPSEQENPVHGWVDQYQIDQQSNNSTSNCKIFQMSYTPPTHYSESALILIQGNGTDQQLWGIRDFTVNTLNCPNQCLRCDEEEQCEQWELVYNQTYDNSTDSVEGIIKYKKQNETMSIKQQQLQEKCKVWISFLYFSQYNDDQVTLEINNYDKTFKIFDLNFLSIGQNNNNSKILRLSYYSDNQSINSSIIQIKSSSQYWGISDVYIYLAKYCKKRQIQIDEQQNCKNDEKLSLLSVEPYGFPKKAILKVRGPLGVYNVINGLKGSQVTSILNGGIINGGYEIFDIHTRVQKNIFNLSEINISPYEQVQVQFNLLLYLIGKPNKDHLITIQFQIDDPWDFERIEGSQNYYYLGKAQWFLIHQRKIFADDDCFQQQTNELYQITACQVNGQFEMYFMVDTTMQFQIFFTANDQLDTSTESYEDIIRNVYWGFEQLQLFYEPKMCGNLFLNTHYDGERIQICENNTLDIQFLQIQSIQVPSGYELLLFSERNQQNQLIIQENKSYLKQDLQKGFSLAKLQLIQEK